VKVLLVPFGIQVTVVVDICSRGHRLLLAPTLQMVNPFMSPPTVQLKMKVASGQVEAAGVNCAKTLPGEK